MHAGLWVCLLVGPVLAAETDLSRILRGIENRYNGARTLQVAFEQTFRGQGPGRRTERGTLYLRKPGKMRWQYSEPAGKLFITDGKLAWLYTPSSNRVEKMRLKESDDLRAPLAFLIGRLDFDRDFKRFVWRREGGDHWVVAEPKSDQAAYRQVEFLVNPQFQIRRLVVRGQDNSVMDFRFQQERLNPSLNGELFQFEPPPGATVVESNRGEGDEAGGTR